MGGRGGSGIAAEHRGENVRKVPGISIGERLFAQESEVARLSQNTVWVENTNTPHAVLKNRQGTTQVRGDKKDKYGLLEHVNTAVVHLSGVDRSNPTREITKLNKQLVEIRSRGFDVQRISVGLLIGAVLYAGKLLLIKAVFAP